MNKCDCGEQLIFDGMVKILDKYDNKVLVCNKYYCDKCGNEYEINEEVEEFKAYSEIHKQAWENWTQGDITKVWHEDNALCIKYESGEWWHYRLNNNNNLEWW